MSKQGFPISRRTVLRGAQAALALPWLEAMLPRRAQSSETVERAPVRMAVLYMPNGIHPDMWTPQGVGRDFQLSPTLEPLEGLRDDLLVLTNLWNAASDEGDGHYVKTSGFLTCRTITKTLGVDLNCHGVSMDQVAAESSRLHTPLPSLELGTEPITTGVDTNVGYTRVYGSHIAWSGPTRPLAKEINPAHAFQRLIRAGEGGNETASRQLRLLDRVRDDAKRLQARLGVADRRRLDEYLQGVHALEGRISRLDQKDTAPWRPRARLDGMATPPEEIPAEHAQHVRLMLDIVAMAFQIDATRVCTFMFGNAVSNRNFSFLDGVKGTHHSLSHHERDEDKLRQYQLINRWHVEQYAYLLQRLRSMREGDHSLLDNSMILFGAGLRDGNQHDPHNLPILLAGGGGGRIDRGQHLAFDRDTPLSNLYVSMLDAFGVPVDSFADSTGKLPGVLT